MNTVVMTEFRAPPVVPSVITLRLSASEGDDRSIEEKITTLIQDICDFKRLPKDMKKKLLVWAYLNLPLFKATTEVSYKRLASSLCSLLTDVIEPLILSDDGEEGYVFEKTMIGLLKSVLPKDTDVDDYIAEYQKLNDEFLAVKEAACRIGEESIEQITQTASEFCDRHEGSFEEIKGSLITHLTDREERVILVKKALESIPSAIAALNTEFQRMKQESEEGIQRQRAQLELSKRLIAQASDLLKEAEEL